jgi:2-polyprenyl-3-methyl-5-hydroxy-6-metoxy-1,4-benzoquinol methylase
MSVLRRAVVAGLARFNLKLSRLHTPQVDALAHNSPESVDRFYADAQWVSEYLSAERLQFYRDVLRVAATHAAHRYARRHCDIGCGTGHLLKLAEEEFRPEFIAGYETSEQAVKIARQVCPKATVEVLDICRETPSERFDLIFCTEVLEHLVSPEAALAHILASASDNALIVLTVPDGRQDTYGGHINFWSPESWRHFFALHAEGYPVDCGVFGEEGRHNYACLQVANRRKEAAH